MDKQKSNGEKAFEIFQAEAKSRGTNYFGDLVKENLNRLTNSGQTPEQAVKTLYAQAERAHRRR